MKNLHFPSRAADSFLDLIKASKQSVEYGDVKAAIQMIAMSVSGEDKGRATNLLMEAGLNLVYLSGLEDGDAGMLQAQKVAFEAKKQ
ncbi:hypothetical protein [Limimaricola cinnabarinus]|uniref:hypothetical protein n=1 Tax=Limimaricola cinnabarinus TaxID=1125964 RepID=UPI002490EC2E|nr:hypothetical protein [Limimaricola cinnabarinus]